MGGDLWFVEDDNEAASATVPGSNTLAGVEILVSTDNVEEPRKLGGPTREGKTACHRSRKFTSAAH